MPLALHALATPAGVARPAAKSGPPGEVAAGSGKPVSIGLPSSAADTESSQPEPLALSTLKAQIKQLEKQIAARKEALARLMADNSMPADVKRDRVRMAQMEITALQMGVAKAYQAMSELLNKEGATAIGSQLSTRA